MICNEGNENNQKRNENLIEYIFTSENISSKNFHLVFDSIRKKYHIKQSRKTQIDSILKKIKCKFFRMIHEIVKSCLNIKIKRLPQSFITNITIEYNKKYLNKTLLQIYQEYSIIPLNFYDSKNEYVKSELGELFFSFTSKNIKMIYNEYIKSQRFEKDFEDIKKKYGKQISLLYDFVSKNYLGFFLNNNKYSNKNKIKDNTIK